MSKNTITIKKSKVVAGFENLQYSVSQWFIDSTKGNCLWFTVKSTVNNIEFLCILPNTINLIVDSGVYVSESIASEDLQNLMTMWNECPLSNLFIKVMGRYIIKTGNTYMVYEEGVNNLSKIDEYINTADMEASGSEPNIIVTEKNPFDMLMMNEEIPKTPQKRIDTQPCILVDYEGYSLGQGIPIRNFVDFFNKKQVSENIQNLCIDVKSINDFQNMYIDKLYKTAISTCEDFLNTIKKNYSDLQKNNEDTLYQFKKLQTILQSNKTGIRENAIGILQELLHSETTRRTETIEFLQTIISTFSRV